jgi:hypothetical protein
MIIGVAIAADISDPPSQDIPRDKKYQFYAPALSTYTSVTINTTADMKSSICCLGYVLNKGDQDIEVFLNYVDDPTNTMNGINVPGGVNAQWNISPANLKISSLKVRSTTAAFLDIEILLH